MAPPPRRSPRRRACSHGSTGSSSSRRVSGRRSCWGIRPCRVGRAAHRCRLGDRRDVLETPPRTRRYCVGHSLTVLRFCSPSICSRCVEVRSMSVQLLIARGQAGRVRRCLRLELTRLARQRAGIPARTFPIVEARCRRATASVLGDALVIAGRRISTGPRRAC